MQHTHCEACILKHCTVRADGINICPITTCEQGCGARYHSCLQEEHTLLCFEEKVHCINVVYGCPVMMPRRKLGSHLEVCPASVLCCPIEWNRWPMHSQEDGQKMSLPLSCLSVKCGQLDVALAMRDQRMLIESLNAPKKTKRIMRNSLTIRFPAAPFSHRSSSFDSDNLTSEETSRNVSDDDSDVPWNLGHFPPGLQRSVCSRLIRATRQTTDSLSAALDVVSNHMHSSQENTLSEISEICEKEKKMIENVLEYNDQSEISIIRPANPTVQVNSSSEWGFPIVKEGSILSKTSPEDILSKQGIHSSMENKKKSFGNRRNKIGPGTKLCDVLGVDINIDCITKYQPKPPEMYTFLCAQEFRRDEYAWHFKNVHNDIQSCLNGWMEQRCPLAYLGCTFSFRRFEPSRKGASIIHSSLQESFGLALNNHPPSFHDGAACEAMDTSSLSDVVVDTPSANEYDYNHESSCKLSDEPRLNNEKKRNASESLLRESIHEFEPEIFTSYRAYSPVVVSFMPVATNPVAFADEKAPQNFGLILTGLPFEVLQHIARCLDSFSLCNLALTSKLLREVCCSLLDERGIVTQMWEKNKIGQKVVWQIHCNRWRFSTAFSPVPKWQFTGINPIGEHLKTCPFNQDKLIRNEPFSVYPPGDAPMDTKLRDLLAERQRESVSLRLRELNQWQQQFQ